MIKLIRVGFILRNQNDWLFHIMYTPCVKPLVLRAMSADTWWWGGRGPWPRWRSWWTQSLTPTGKISTILCVMVYKNRVTFLQIQNSFMYYFYYTFFTLHFGSQFRTQYLDSIVITNVHIINYMYYVFNMCRKCPHGEFLKRIKSDLVRPFLLE